MEGTKKSKWNGRVDDVEPIKYGVFRSRYEKSTYVNSHSEVIPMGYVNSLEEFDAYVLYEYPNAVKKKSHGQRGAGEYYYYDGSYNVFCHRLDKLKTK